GLITSGSPSSPAQQVTYTATVTSQTAVTGPFTGSVTFTDNNADITGTCEAGSQLLTVGGTATCKITYANTTGSPHPIKAIYSGDGVIRGSTSNPVNEVRQSCADAFVVTAEADDGRGGTARTGINGGVCPGGTITFAPAVHTIELANGSGELVIGNNMTITGS